MPANNYLPDVLERFRQVRSREGERKRTAAEVSKAD